MAVSLATVACQRTEVWLRVANASDAAVIVEIGTTGGSVRAWTVASGTIGPAEYVPSGSALRVYSEECVLLGDAVVTAGLGRDPAFAVEPNGDFVETELASDIEIDTAEPRSGCSE